MSYRCPGTFSQSPSTFCSHSFSRHLVPSTYFCAPRIFQLRSSRPSFQPTRCRTSCLVSSPSPRFCHHQRLSTPCSPCRTTCPGSLGFGSRSCHVLGLGSMNSCTLGCRSGSCHSSSSGHSGCTSLGYRVRGFPSFGCKSGVFQQTSMTSRRFHAAYSRPFCGSGFWRSAC
ncbi:keratin-associated protein 13-3-like [Thomomys bottae]